MSAFQKGIRPSRGCSSCSLRFLSTSSAPPLAYRSFSTSARRLEYSEARAEPLSTPSDLPPTAQSSVLDEAIQSSAAAEDKASEPLSKSPKLIQGSARRRAALRSTSDIPFEQLPYQCFQEALKLLSKDRAEKAIEIEAYSERVAKQAVVLREMETATEVGGEPSPALWSERVRMRKMRKHLEWLKVQADINDPQVKRRFEDGLGDMNKPVYRHLAQRKWYSYERKVSEQRLFQMHVVPDVIGAFSSTAQVNLRFPRMRLQHGRIIPTDISAKAPTVHVQVFDAGERLVTIVVIDSDVPDVERNSFTVRCHGLYTNIPVSPVNGIIDLGALQREKKGVVVPWLPPHCQKGAPYHRLSVWVLQQQAKAALDPEAMKAQLAQDAKFDFRKLRTVYKLHAVGATMFRTVWDEFTRPIMKAHGLEGADTEFKPMEVEPMPYKKKDGARYR